MEPKIKEKKIDEETKNQQGKVGKVEKSRKSRKSMVQIDGCKRTC